MSVLRSLTARRRPASLLATAMGMRQAAGGGGGRQLGFDSPAKMGATGVRSPLRPGFIPFCPLSGGKKAPFTSGVPPPNKTEHAVLLEKMEEIGLSMEALKKQQKSTSNFALRASVVVAVIGICYGGLKFSNFLGSISSEDITNFLKSKFHEFSRDEDTLKEIDLMVLQHAASIKRSFNPFAQLMEGAATFKSSFNLFRPRTGEDPESAPRQFQFETEWGVNASLLAETVQRMYKNREPLNEENIMNISIAKLGYSAELTSEILSALVSIGYVKKRRGLMSGVVRYEIRASYAESDLLANKAFLEALREAEKARATK